MTEIKNNYYRIIMMIRYKINNLNNSISSSNNNNNNDKNRKQLNTIYSK